MTLLSIDTLTLPFSLDERERERNVIARKPHQTLGYRMEHKPLLHLRLRLKIDPTALPQFGLLSDGPITNIGIN